MSTRSAICLKLNDTRCLATYCHFEGYVDHQGPLLLAHYNTKERLMALLELGSLAFLAPEIGEKHQYRNADRNHPDWCCFFNRDRGDKDDAWPATLGIADIFKDHWFDFAYLFDLASNAWSVASRKNKTFVPLAGHPDLPGKASAGTSAN